MSNIITEAKEKITLCPVCQNLTDTSPCKICSSPKRDNSVICVVESPEPGLPYDWMSSPPSVNRVLGIWWLGNLLYPQLYDYDMTAVAQEYYRLFWHYDLSAEEAAGMLSRSTLRT